MAQKHRVVLIAPRFPEFDRQSGSRRIAHIMQMLAGQAFELVFVAEVEGDLRYRRAVEERGVQVQVASEPVLRRLLDHHVYAVLLFFWRTAERWAPLVRAVSPTARIVADTVDLEFVREARKQTRERTNGAIDDRFRWDTAGRELAAYRSADALIAVSDHEAGILREVCGATPPTFVLPDAEQIDVSANGFEARRGQVFVGNFWHDPNHDAIDYYVSAIHPRLSPATRLRHPLSIIGNASEQLAGRLPPDVRLIGRVPDVLPYVGGSRISLVPLRYGAGTKRKLLESLLIGTPVVTTSVGAEGLNLRADQDVLVADDPAGFARCIEMLLYDRERWRTLAVNGRRRVEPTHGFAAVGQRLVGLLFELPPPRPAAAIRSSAQFPSAAVRPAYQAIASRPPPPPRAAPSRRSRVLVAGVYLSEHPNAIASVVAELGRSSRYDVLQRWVQLGNGPHVPRDSGLIALRVNAGAKYELLNRVVALQPLRTFDYLIVCDDDIGLPGGFLDAFMAVVEAFDLGLAQPARTASSYIDHLITMRQPGVVARQTLFVESGPLIAMRRDAIAELTPFDLRSPMGWGYENVWAGRLDARGIRLGIVDVTPVEHSMRRPAQYYAREIGEAGRIRLLAEEQHFSTERCYRVLDVLAEAG